MSVGVSFDYWKTWEPQTATLPGNIVFLSPQQITDPCAPPTPPGDCRQTPLVALSPESLVVEWADTTLPDLSYPNVPGDEMATADKHHHFKAEAVTPDAVCTHQLGDYKELVYIPLHQGRDQYYVVSACIRAADPTWAIDAVVNMVLSSTITEQ
jgi:hypothetical protein